MSTGATILVVDDEPSMLRYTSTLLRADGYNVETASSGMEAVERLSMGFRPGLMLLDMAMPGMNGMQTIEACKRIHAGQKIVVISCVATTSSVVQAIKLGALDYITKPFYKAELDSAIKRSMELAVSKSQSAETLRYSVKDNGVEDLEDDFFFLAASPLMKQLRAQVNLIAKVNVPVLLLGETGVGKEILAKLIHKLSQRANRPLLKVNCAALPSGLLESELFGYEAGAFTGAHKSKPGQFELCNRGTLLLDEIGEMSPLLQPKLLEVLQDGRFSPLGSRASRQVDVRVLAATNIDIPKAIENKTFREDLYYRLNAITLSIPPLRQRREEIPLLLKHFMLRLSEQYAQTPLVFCDALQKACLNYPWPGNLRELGNFVKRFLILKDTEMALSELEHGASSILPDGSEIGGTHTVPGALKTRMQEIKGQAEVKAIGDALALTGWNRKRAAAYLRISYKALLYKIKQYHLEPQANPTDRFEVAFAETTAENLD